MTDDRQAWLNRRRQGIGGSEAPIVHGASPYKTALMLFEQKIDPTPPKEENGYIQEKGNEFEPRARALFAAEYNMVNGTNETFDPVFMEMADLPIMFASMDGASKDLQVLSEFKFQGKEPHDNVIRLDLPVRGGRVPEHYWIQCQHQLMVSGARVNCFVSYRPANKKTGDKESLRWVEVFPDVEFMKHNLTVCIDFWERVLAKKPPPLTTRDYKELRVKGIKAKVTAWRKLKEKHAAIDKEMKALREEILPHVSHTRMRCAGVRFLQIKEEGRMDYKKLLTHERIAPIVSEIGLDSFKGKGNEYIKMEVE